MTCSTGSIVSVSPWRRGQRSQCDVVSGPNKHQSAVTCLQFCRGLVLSSSDDGTVKLWDLKTGAWLRDVVALQSRGSGQDRQHPPPHPFTVRLTCYRHPTLNQSHVFLSRQVASCGESERPTLGWCAPPAAGTGRRRPNCWCWTSTWTTRRRRRTEEQ